MIDKKPDKRLPDRPLECGECKKPIAIKYTEIVGETITQTNMCADCPELQRRLYGTNPAEHVANQMGVNAGLCCGNCGTTLEEVKRGHRLGCTECYNVFGDILVIELLASHRLPPRFAPAKKSSPLHIGRAPGQTLAINVSSRLLALSEALRETLNREDYEQAAWLRDQIRALTENEEKSNERKEPEQK